ncbi:MAG TPA: hypothetical protein VFP19_09035, partial [Candidatus Limnocylindrales bacterium]|nr:hypothetical protein [Candidatus Limnocylindrales bacterium]
VLANGRYAPSTRLGKALLSALLEDEVAPSRRTAPNTATLAARDAVEGLLRHWDDAIASRLFAMNVELDEPLIRRRAFAEHLAATHGRLERDPASQPVSRSPFHLEWWLRGEHGRVKAEILLSPELPPLVQTLNLTSVPEPPPPLGAAAERIAAALTLVDGTAPRWPAELPLAASVDADALARSMRATEARFGTVRIESVVASDGLRSATFRLVGSRGGSLDLALERDDVTGEVSAVKLSPTRLGTVAIG